jgi:hypothetical protein
VYAVGKIKGFRRLTKGEWRAVVFDLMVNYNGKDYGKNCIYEGDGYAEKIDEFYNQFRDGDYIKIKADRERWRKNKDNDRDFFSTQLVVVEFQKLKDNDEGQRKQEEEILRNQIENEHKKSLEDVETQKTLSDDDLPF